MEHAFDPREMARILGRKGSLIQLSSPSAQRSTTTTLK
jgi:hypothetical protein